MSEKINEYRSINYVNFSVLHGEAVSAHMYYNSYLD